MTTPANHPPTPQNGPWLAATVELADGSTLELRIPEVVSATITSYAPAVDETPIIIRATVQGQRRRAPLTKLFEP
jgi:hypothetical protein